MIDLLKIHDRELFNLVGQRVLTLTEIQPVLATLGFVFEDDFAWLKLAGTFEPWRTTTLVHCEFLAQGAAVYPDELDFDSLRLAILAASLPEDEVVKALHVIFDIAEQTQLNVVYASRSLFRSEIPALVSVWTQDILRETGDICGSESVAILISMTYDGRRSS